MNALNNLISGSLFPNPAPELPYSEWVAGTKAIQDIVDKHGLTDVTEGVAFGFLTIDLLHGMDISSEDFYFIIAKIITQADVQKLNMNGFFGIRQEDTPLTAQNPGDLVMVENNEVTFQTPNHRVRTVRTEQKLHD